MRTQFVSMLRGRSFKLRAAIWAGVVVVLLMFTTFGSLVWLAGHHLVKTEKGLVVVPKRFVRLAGTRVDIRGWTWNDAVAHHEVSRALINAGYTDVLPQPPLEPTAMEKTSEKAKHLRDEAVAAGSNLWQRVKAKTLEWSARGTNSPSSQAGR